MSAINPVQHTPPLAHSSLHTSPDLALTFQNALKAGDIAKVQQLLAKGLSVNDPLPNQERPLHLAVCTNQEELVTLLLKQGAEPDLPDAQQLSAIDHALLMKKEHLLAHLIGSKIGKDVREVQQQMTHKGSVWHIQKLEDKIKKITNIDVTKLSSMNKGIFEGNLETVPSSFKGWNVNACDAHGLAPIHYAILGKHTAVLDQLLAKGASIHTLSSEGNSALHFAALSGSPAMLKKVIELTKDKLNIPNAQGQTPLHYAAAKDQLASVETLIKSGANPALLDNNAMSALALIGNSTLARDPTAVSLTQQYLFTATCLYWGTQLALHKGWVNHDDTLLFMVNIWAACYAAGIYASEFAHLIQNLSTSWKKGLAWTGLCGLALLPPCNVGFQAWRTYHTALSALEAIKKSLPHIKYRKWAVINNVITHSVNNVQSATTLLNESHKAYDALTEPERYWNIIYEPLHKLTEAFEKWDAPFRKIREELKELNEELNRKFNASARFNFGGGFNDNPNKRDPNPDCNDHTAVKKLAETTFPGFKWATFKGENGITYLQNLLKKMRFKLHPDKHPEDQEEYTKRFLALGNLNDRLEKYLTECL